MGVLQAFERRLGGLVEGAFAKVFRGDVQPVEIASALARETDDKKNVVGTGKVLVPNDFVVELGDHDHQRLEEWTGPLGDELAAMVREHAAERGYSFVGPVRVAFDHVPDLATGTFRIRSGVDAAKPVDGAIQHIGNAPASDLAAAGARPTGALAGRPRLLIASGGTAPHDSPEARGEQPAFFLTRPISVIGRAQDCDLTLNDPGVSRRHAEVRSTGEETEILDLGSTNGIRVNGGLVAQSTLRNGDRVDIGTTSLIFRRDES